MKKIYILTSMLLFASIFGFAQNGNDMFRKTSKKNPLVYTPVAPTSTAYFPKGLSGIKPLGAPIFSEDFQGGVIPATFKLINGDNKTPDTQVSFVNDAWVVAEDFDDQTNFVAVSTSYYQPPSTSDDWMITPSIAIPSGVTRLTWKAKAQDSNFPDGYKVKLSTTGDNKADFTKTLFTIAVENDTWTTRTIDLSTYAGQNVYIAFQNTTFDGFLLMVDDIVVSQPDQYDVSLSKPNTYEYPITPLKQAYPYNDFSALIKNTGGSAVTSPTLNIDINTGVFTDNIVGSNPLNPNDTVRLKTSLNFVPATVDSYKVAYTASVAETETNLLDNSAKTVFVVSDSVLAREDGIRTGSLGIGSGGGILGQAFTLNKLDTLTSISFYLANPTAGDKITVDIYSFTTKPGNVLASTIELTIPNSTGNWYTLPIEGNYVALPAGTFFLGMNETNANVTLGTTTNYFKPNTGWVNFGTNGWQPSEFYNFKVTYLLRANFGQVKQLPPYEVKLISTHNAEYPILPILQAAGANMTFAGLMKNVGGLTVNNPTLNVNINSGLYNENAVLTSLNKGDTATFRTTNPFTPPSTGTYTVDFTASISDPETNLLDNTIQNQFEVSDSVMSRESGNADGYDFLGAGSAGVMGQVFNINTTDTLTSVSFFLRNPTIGDVITADVYNFSSTPLNVIASTVKLTITDTSGQWYTLKIDGNFVEMTPGSYFIGINQNGKNVNIGFNSNYFTPNTTFFKLGTGSWTANETIGLEFAYLLRANFGKVVPLPNFDVRIENPNTFEYTLYPKRQAKNMGFSARLKNTGAAIVNNPTMNVDINSGVFTNNSSVATLNPKDTVTLATTSLFNAPGAGTYNIKYTASVSNAETNLTDNVVQAQFEVSDSVMAREKGPHTGALGIGGGGGTLGQIFTLANQDSLTSVTFFLRSPTKGDTVDVDIYNFASTPTNIIASTNYVVIKDTSVKWYTVRVKGNYVALTPGTYFVGVNERVNNVTLGTNTNYFKPNTSWVIFGTNPWQPSEFYNFNVAYLLRPNFGKVVPLPANDASLSLISSPVSGSCLAQETVKVTIVNNGGNTISNFPVSFKVDNNAPVTETVTTSINSLNSIVYTFTATANLTTSGNHTIKVYTALTGDNIKTNDTLKITVNNIASVTPTYTMGFEPIDVLDGWSILDANANNNTWQYVISGGNNFDGCARYNGGTTSGNDWLFSQCVDLDSTKMYEISFYYRANAKSSTEKLRFKMGTVKTSLGMSILLNDFTTVNDTVYKAYIKTNFKPAASGSYYFGWLAYSVANSKGIRIDDFMIDETVGVNEVNANRFTINLSPNPASNMVNVTSELPIKNIRIINAMGQQLSSENENTNSVQLDTRNLPVGMYFLQIETKDGTSFHKLNISK